MPVFKLLISRIYETTKYIRNKDVSEAVTIEITNLEK